MNWEAFAKKISDFFNGFSTNGVSYVMEFIFFAVLFYYVFKVLQSNKNFKFIVVFLVAVVWCGFSFSLSENIQSQFLLIVIIMLSILVFTMYNTEIKRVLLDTMVKGKNNRPKVSASGVDVIIDEMIRAIQNMSKNNVGALIVLSNENLPEGIIESGTIVNAEITSQMIEAVFYPKAPLHDGAMIVEGSKIYAAAAFYRLPKATTSPRKWQPPPCGSGCNLGCKRYRPRRFGRNGHNFHSKERRSQKEVGQMRRPQKRTQRLLLVRPYSGGQRMKKIAEFFKGFFTKYIPIKILAIVLAALTVMLINLN